MCVPVEAHLSCGEKPRLPEMSAPGQRSTPAYSVDILPRLHLSPIP